MSKQSREAFLEQIRSGQLKTKQDKVYTYIWMEGPLSLDALRYHIDMPHQTLTSAISRLMDLGVVEQDIDGFFFAANERDYENNAEARDKEKYKKWVKKGQEMGWHHRYTRDRITEDGLFWDNYNQV